MNEYEVLKAEIAKIHERNLKVDADKAWEQSLFRKIVIGVLTYASIVIFFFLAGLADPFINAIVPTLGFGISTLSVTYCKKLWVRYWYGKR